MATLVLTAVAGSLGLSGWGLFAATLAATAIGTFIDNQLFGQGNTQQEGPRLQEISVSSSSEGRQITKLWGRQRLGGNLIWVTNFKETVKTEEQGGGKGLGGGGVDVTTYTYSMSFAIAFIEGNARTSLGQVWADGQLLDMSKNTYRFYPGSATQGKDAKIEAVEGSANVPAFRGVAYLVFEDFQLVDFGNRIPQITAEIIKPIGDDSLTIMENLITGVQMIPSTGEVIYATTPIIRDDGNGNTIAENVHLKSGTTDFELSMDDLQNQMPNVNKISVVVGWFGTDLRASHCEFVPKVESNSGRNLSPFEWSVSGQVRADVDVVSTYTDGDGNEHPSFGGTPADFSVVECMQHIADEMDKDVYFYPFILMDIPAGNGLPDPYGGSEQAAFPWRGRITTSDPSTVDGTAGAATEVADLFGSVAVGDFNVSGTTVTYTGSPSDHGLRRMILHYAHLCAATGQTFANSARMKGFFISSELVGITRIRSGAGVYPAVARLKTLLADVRSIFDSAGLTNVQLSYAADWSEYHSHQAPDGLYFNMDPLWLDAECDFVAFDNYLPISDWRDGKFHLDYGTGSKQGLSEYSETYLQSQIEGGELFDYYYASSSDRDDQIRTPITDGAYGKPWVFRQKDIRSWWSQPHYNRPSGVESGATTGWTGANKRIVFSEYGCPAVNRGTNQPNVFVDPKSSESFYPYYSKKNRDDQIMRSYYEAIVKYWAANSPTSPSLMLSTTEMFAWTWDARPYPAYPYRSDVWADYENYRLGHWLNGRVGVTPLGELVKQICKQVGFTDLDLDVIDLVNSSTVVRGYSVDSIMSPREMLNPLFASYFFDGYESEGLIKFAMRGNTVFLEVDKNDFIIDGSDYSGFSLSRSEDIDLPSAARVAYIDEGDAFQIGSTGGQRQIGHSYNVLELRFPIVLDPSFAKLIGEIILQESWVARENAELKLPASFVRLDPNDGITMPVGARQKTMKITNTEMGNFLSLKMTAIEASIYDAVVYNGATSVIGGINVYGKSILYIMDLPLLTGQELRPWAPRVVAYQNPFPSSVLLYRDTGTDFLLYAQVIQRTQMGLLAVDLPAGPTSIIDEGNVIQVDMNDPTFTVLGDTEDNVRAGKNAIAIRTSNGDWEVLQYINSDFQGGRRYNLSRLIRGQLGTEAIMEDPIPAGSPVVFLDPAVMIPVNISNEQKLFPIDYTYGPAEYPTSSPFYQDVSFQGQAVGLMPYAPAALAVAMTGTSDDVEFTWIRRTRFDAEDLEAENVPLNEEFEKYDLEILDVGGTTVVRTLANLTSPSYTYSTADQTTDHGGPLTTFNIRVYQISAAIGRGRRAAATVSV